MSVILSTVYVVLLLSSCVVVVFVCLVYIFVYSLYCMYTALQLHSLLNKEIIIMIIIRSDTFAVVGTQEWERVD